MSAQGASKGAAKGAAQGAAQIATKSKVPALSQAQHTWILQRQIPSLAPLRRAASRFSDGRLLNSYALGNSEVLFSSFRFDPVRSDA